MNIEIPDRVIEHVSKSLQIGLEMSTCVKRPISSVLWVPKDVFVMGANGPPAKFSHYCNPCPRADSACGVDMDICPAVHGEMAAILNAARHGIITEGAILFISCGLPCKDCMKEIAKAGIKYIVSPYPVCQVEREDKFSNAKTYNFSLSYEIMVCCDIQYIHEPRLMGENNDE